MCEGWFYIPCFWWLVTVTFMGESWLKYFRGALRLDGDHDDLTMILLKIAMVNDCNSEWSCWSSCSLRSLQWSTCSPGLAVRLLPCGAGWTSFSGISCTSQVTCNDIVGLSDKVTLDESHIVSVHCREEGCTTQYIPTRGSVQAGQAVGGSAGHHSPPWGRRSLIHPSPLGVWMLLMMMWMMLMQASEHCIECRPSYKTLTATDNLQNHSWWSLRRSQPLLMDFIRQELLKLWTTAL